MSITDHLNAYAAQIKADTPSVVGWGEWTHQGNNVYAGIAAHEKGSSIDLHLVSCTPGRAYRLNVVEVEVNDDNTIINNATKLAMNKRWMP